jgi:hypothetical protein
MPLRYRRAEAATGGDSSRIRPANDRETSRNDGNVWSLESAGQRPDSSIAAGSGIGPENTLKVETWFKSRWDSREWFELTADDVRAFRRRKFM